MKGTNAIELCEAQMCLVVDHWLRSKLSSHGEIGDSHVTSISMSSEDRFRCVLEEQPKPKEKE